MRRSYLFMEVRAFIRFRTINGDSTVVGALHLRRNLKSDAAKNIDAARAGCKFGTCMGACSLADVFTTGAGGALGGVAISMVENSGEARCQIPVKSHLRA